MKVENPVAYRFILQEELYLLDKDKASYMQTESQPVIQTQPVNFKYLGGHKKNFLIIVHYSAHEVIDDKHLTALQSIFKRLELSMDDVAILNRANYSDAPFEDLTDFFNPRKLLLLGQDALPAGIDVLTLNKAAVLNNCNTLFSFSFDEMMDNNENKKAFWEQLKQL